DNTVNTLDGDITAADGATGVVVTGDDTRTTINGDIYASGGATGLTVSGNAASVTNQGSITAVDSGSTGVAIDGNTASFTNTGTIDSSLNGTGVSITGNSASVTLDGTVNVHAEKNADGVYQGATGVSVAGNNGTTDITGDVAISGSMDESDVVAPEGTLTGVEVSGTGNTVTLDGAVNMTLDSTHENDINAFTATGIAVTGNENTININGGVNVSTSSIDKKYDDARMGHNAYGVTVTGNNTVNVSGQSTVDITGSVGATTGLATLSDGGHLVLNSDSVLDINYHAASDWGYAEGAVMTASGPGSSIDNRGVINATTGTTIARVSGGATINNSGTVDMSPALSNSSFSQAGAFEASGTGSSAINAQGGTISITSDYTPYLDGGVAKTPVFWSQNTGYALLATNYGSVENDAGATINLNGAGLYGVAAAKGTATNAGTINVDGFIPTLDEDGNITAKSFYSTGYLPTMSAGVITGSTDTGYGNATGLNTGTINVNNEGFGMLALNGGTVTNQGTINLTADEGVTASADNQLIGMGVINGGSAINDESGVININA
ncbi:hypothetical protein, partial [Trabulsiella guamensis]|uniref:beta strand repeat-containing protein n=1 Tax=Trabulsiella guamensis TaxID=158852 RepID=UPI00056F1A82